MIKQIIIILVFSLVTIYIINLLKVRLSSVYFSLKQIIVSEEEDITARGLILTFSPPFCISILLSFITTQDKFQVCITYGLLTSFLIVWPTLLNARQLLDTETYKKKNSLYFIYIIYVLIYMLVSYCGYILYSTISSSNITNKINLPRFLIFYSSLNPLYQNLIASALWSIFAFICVYVYKVILKKFVASNKPIKAEI